MLRIFTPVKIQRLRPGLNTRTSVPEVDVNGNVGYLKLWHSSHYNPCSNSMVERVSEKRFTMLVYYLLTQSTDLSPS